MTRKVHAALRFVFENRKKEYAIVLMVAELVRVAITQQP